MIYQFLYKISLFSANILSFLPNISDHPLPEGFEGGLTLVISYAYHIVRLPFVRILFQVINWYIPIFSIFFTWRIIIFIINNANFLTYEQNKI